MFVGIKGRLPSRAMILETSSYVMHSQNVNVNVVKHKSDRDADVGVPNG